LILAFRGSAQSSLKEVLGDSGRRAVFHHLDPVDYQDVEGFHAKLKTAFGLGTFTLEGAIVEQLALRMDVPASKLIPNDIVGSFSLAPAFAEHRRKA
jgi:hypothetical protein